MKLERTANYASLFPVVQQAVALCTLIYGIAMLVLHAARHEAQAGQKMILIKNDLRTLAKAVVRAIPIIATIFSIVLLVKDKESKDKLETTIDLVLDISMQVHENKLEITIDQDFLTTHPLEVLDVLGDFLDKNNQLPTHLSIKFKGEIAKDETGLSRKFLSTLITESARLLFPGGAMPTLNEINDAKKLRCFGYLLHVAGCTNNPVGNHFPPLFFDGLVAAKDLIIRNDEEWQLIRMNALLPLHSDMSQENIMSLLALPVEQLTENDLNFLAETLSLEDNLPTWWETPLPSLKVLQTRAREIRNEVAKRYTEYDEELQEDNKYLNPLEIKRFLLEKIKNSTDERTIKETGQIKALMEIAKCLYPTSGKYKDNNSGIELLNAESLKIAIEGFPLTATKIKFHLKEIEEEVIVVEGEEIVTGKDEKGYNKKLYDFLVRWIDENENDTEKFKKFVKALVGSENLNDDDACHIYDNSELEGIICFSYCAKACYVNYRTLRNYAVDALFEEAKSEEHKYYEHSKRKIKKKISDDELYTAFKEHLEDDIKIAPRKTNVK